MKKIFFLLVCSLILGNIDAFAQPAGNGIKFFQGSFEQALAEAKKQNKPLFVDFYAVWCGPCKRMAKTVFTQDSVGSYFNDKFISLQLDAEKSDNVAIAKQYKVRSEEHTSELQSRQYLVCRLLLEKKKYDTEIANEII